ncbi:MAG: carbamoyltransferase N-terminal domain-containing protein, partial [Planctomyces sp.]
MNIIGMNAYHGDASAALVVDGKLVAAVEEERFNRIKHWAGFPAQSIRWCLQHAGVRPDDVQHVSISFNPRANLWRRLAFVAKARPSFRSLLDRLRRQGRTLSLEDQYAEAVG